MAIAQSQSESGMPRPHTLSKTRSLKLDHGLFVFGIDRWFVIEGKAHAQKQ
jgi:hypothetical protein